MKILQKDIALNQPGSVKIIPEELDDLWLAYNIIAPGDVLAADTTRKVSYNKGAEGKAKDASRVKIKIEIKITAVDYENNSSTLRVRGKSLVGNECIASGAFHTLQIEVSKQFDLSKKLWDSTSIDALQEGSDRASGADLAVILIQQDLAHVYLVGNRATALCAKIEARKSSASNKYFEDLFRAFVKHVDFNVVRCVVIGSPGSIKDNFRRHLMLEAQRMKMKSIETNKSRFVMVGIVANGSINDNLKVALHDRVVMGLIKNTKAALEIRAFEEFLDVLTKDPDRACYGSKSVEAAQEMTAVETLLITDDLLRNRDIALRRKYIELVKSVKNTGGKAFTFSSTHVSGEQLAQLTGIAAILRFPLPDLDDMVL